jgi:hypothetical protein
LPAPMRENAEVALQGRQQGAINFVETDAENSD